MFTSLIVAVLLGLLLTFLGIELLAKILFEWFDMSGFIIVPMITGTMTGLWVWLHRDENSESSVLCIAALISILCLFGRGLDEIYVPLIGTSSFGFAFQSTIFLMYISRKLRNGPSQGNQQHWAHLFWGIPVSIFIGGSISAINGLQIELIAPLWFRIIIISLSGWWIIISLLFFNRWHVSWNLILIGTFMLGLGLVTNDNWLQITKPKTLLFFMGIGTLISSVVVMVIKIIVAKSNKRASLNTAQKH